MCGIAGELISWPDGSNQPNTIHAMVEALSHRGPDEQGYHSETLTLRCERVQINLGMSRLAIIDRAHGQQPMGMDCKVFFNGEIYNHKELRYQARRSGRLFETHCDTEIIVHAYQEFGQEFVKHLEGMFAIAIWDIQKQRLYLYRDRIGKKPLYYYFEPEHAVFLFASELKSILLHPAYVKKPNLEGLYHYISLQYVPEPMTAFEGIRALEPGTMLEYDPIAHVTQETRWNVWTTQIQPFETEAEAIQAIRENVTNAVDRRLESEVPLGIYQSGGIDSTIITALASQSPNRPKELHTFTMGFQEQPWDETRLAQQVAERYNTIHHVETVNAVDVADMAESIVHQYDQPFGDCSAIPTMLLAQRSRKYITVALSGDGGDETFGGYPRYWMTHGELTDYVRYMLVWPPRLRQTIVSPWWKDQINAPSSIDWISDHAFRGPGQDPWNRIMYADIMTYLPNDIIVKMERATMAHSIEARCPFLDTSVIDLSYRIPSRFKITAWSGKEILKKTFTNLPAEILIAPKHGFGVPISHWLRTDSGYDLTKKWLVDHDGPLFNKDELSPILDAFLYREGDYGHGIWILIMLAMWWEKHFGG